MAFLLEDFQFRCAYSLLHHRQESKGLEVDHFDPRQKKRTIQRYDNLMPSARLCNSVKRDQWPSPSERELGLRFLNPTEEQDYNHQIFEDPQTHKLVGTTVAARYHIRVLGLNDDFFIRQRLHRSMIAFMFAMPGIMHGNPVVEAVKEALSELIPPIDPPPGKPQT